ncbi:hypothetical protein BLNAU_9955 [Blattamonas nauphoetae]|uniref:Uncharacterized protein n=1 Tax=Blattamonas nauphoetae TaxID=2049346 RepID=A0ABQ9XU78_9EUKA|nr:hypothetical protein BLNAU_9955 [Blattamonas nauphoetae]
MNEPFLQSPTSSEPSQVSFLDWNGIPFMSTPTQSSVYRSLVQMVTDNHHFDDDLTNKAVLFLYEFRNAREEPGDSFFDLDKYASHETVKDFVHSVGMLLSAPNQRIVEATMEFLHRMIIIRSKHFLLKLVKADLIPHLLASLNPVSLSFEYAEDVHIHLVSIIGLALLLLHPNDSKQIDVINATDKHNLQETILARVLLPPASYIRHLCANRHLFINGNRSVHLLNFLTRLISLCPYSTPSMRILQSLPVFFTIPSTSAELDMDRALCWILDALVDAQRDWNNDSGDVRKSGRTACRSLVLEGFEDTLERSIQFGSTEDTRKQLTKHSIVLSNMMGMNAQEGEYSDA